MPTADAYWRAAADFARLSEELGDDALAVRTALTDAVVVGGRLRPTLDEAVAMIVSGAGATADGYAVLAAECRRRAVVCETYTAALASHHRALAVLDGADPQRRARVAAVPPPCPEPWVTPD